MENWKILFKELFYILKPGGKFIFSTYQPHYHIELFKLENYFQNTILQGTWNDIGTVEFYHHTLHDLFQNIINSGFKILSIEEARPDMKIKETDPKLYLTLTKRPFLIFGVIEKT